MAAATLKPSSLFVLLIPCLRYAPGKSGGERRASLPSSARFSPSHYVTTYAAILSCPIRIAGEFSPITVAMLARRGRDADTAGRTGVVPSPI